MKRIIAILERTSPGTIFFCSLGYLAGVAYLDFLTGDVSLAVLYLIAIICCAWFVGRWQGVVVSLLSSSATAFTDFLQGESSLLHYGNLAIEAAVLAVVSLLTSQLRIGYDHEEDLANRDPLTGLPNRRSFFQVAGFLLPVSRRAIRPVTVVYLDLDGFKKVNDAQGHQTGDAVLQAVGRVLMTKLRASDLVARLGGDEFVVFFPEAGFAEATVTLRKLQGELRHAMAERGWPVDFSMGAVTYDETPPQDVDQILREADGLMYAVKQSGGGAIIHESR